MIRKYAIIGALLAAGVGAVGATVVIETQAARIRADSIDITVRGVGTDGDVQSWRIPAPTIAAPTPAPVPPAPAPAPTPTLTVTVTPTAVASGAQATFSWRATGVTGRCTVSDGRQTVTGQPLEATHRVTITRTTTVTVRCGSLSRSATATVTSTPAPPSPPPGPEPEPPTPGNPSYPNRPAHYTRVLSEYGFGDAVPVTQEAAIGGGWTVGRNRSGTVSRVTDGTAPVSPSSVLEWRYPAGFQAGGDVGIVYRSLPAGTNRIYIAFSLKHDSNFEWNSIANKLLYLEPGNLILESRAWGHTLPVYNGARDQVIPPSVARAFPLGEWVQIEYLVDAPTGRVQVWMNGTKLVDATTSLAGNWRELKLDSTWGGLGQTSTRTSRRWIDHILVATP